MAGKIGKLRVDQHALRSLMRYSTILFDFDHTLFDSDASESAAFTQALLSVGIVEPDLYKAAYQKINRELWAAVERGNLATQQVSTRRFERLATECKLDANPLAMAESFVNGLGAHGELYGGARDVIEQLSEHVSLALVTNGLSEVQRARIDRLGISQYFEAVVISADIGHAKPGTAIFDHAFEQLNSPAMDTVLMVGDSLSSDIRGGRNYGIATCWYNRHGKSASPSDTITHQIAELNELFSLVALSERSSQ